MWIHWIVHTRMLYGALSDLNWSLDSLITLGSQLETIQV